MAAAARDLAAALKNSNINNLPNNNIKDNINTLVNLFQSHVDNIVMKKLTPTGIEQIKEDANAPRVIKEDAASPRVIKDDTTSPRVLTKSKDATKESINTSAH